MAIKQINIAELQPTERQWAQNFIIGLDEFNKFALMPMKTPVKPYIIGNWGKYVDTYTNKVYQIDIYEYHLVYKDEIQTIHYHQAEQNSYNPNPNKRFKKALFEKTLKGEVFIFLYDDSTMGFGNDEGQHNIVSGGIYTNIVDILYAFNRLLIATTEVVYWSDIGLNSHTPPTPIADGDVYIDGANNRKQSDTITKEYLGLYTDFVNLYLVTRGGFEVWRPTQDMTLPFIYSTAMFCRIADFDNQYAIMQTEEHSFGIYNIIENAYSTDERWHIDNMKIIDMKSFWHPQNKNKMIAIYEEGGIAWLYDVKFKLMTKLTEAFYPYYELGDGYLDSQIMLLADKGVYASLYIQLGQFPEEIQFCMDNFYMKRAPLIAFERDDVIKTVNIGKLTVDTPLELNFKGYTAIYSIGLDQPSAR